MNIIPIRFRTESKHDLTKIMDTITNEFNASRKAMDESAAALEAMAGGDEAIVRDVRAYVRVCHTLVTGNLEWHVATPRYGMEGYTRGDGSVKIVL
jgi:UDP-N-acetylmuramyl pentapeptide synthase